MKYPVVCFFGDVEGDNVSKKFTDFTCHCYPNDSNVKSILAEHRPNVIVTVGESWRSFPTIARLPFQMRHKWLHYSKLDEIQANNIMHCYVGGLRAEDANNPLVTVFTATYNSGDKIMRPFNSLQRQTYTNWEWVIMDDSSDLGETFEKLKELKSNEYRMRIFKSDKNSGVIGEVKYNAANLGRGSILVEIDHDDELTEDCLENIVAAFKHYPEAGFAYTDFAEVFEKGNRPFKYGDGWAYGYGGYYAQKYRGNVVYVATSVNVNPKTIRNIVGVPNHVRAWRTSVYKELMGHVNLPVGDDYELLVRTFLNTRMVRIPKLGYLQYRNEDGNTTFSRNKEIQKIQKFVSGYYEKQIQKRLKQLGIRDNKSEPYALYWKQPHDYHEQHVTMYMPFDEDTISVIIPTFKRPQELKRAIDSVLAQTYQKFEILVVGDCCPELNNFITQYSDSRIRWWNLQSNSNDSGATPRNYALKKMVRTGLVAYLDDDNIWSPNHLESLVTALKENDADYAFSSFTIEQEHDDGTRSPICDIISTEPRVYRIDTSAILHKQFLVDTYGFWQSGKKLYTHDWDIVSRWKAHKYAATKLPTIRYTVDFNRCNPKKLYEHYRDQNPPLFDDRNKVQEPEPEQEQEQPNVTVEIEEENDE